MSQDLITTVTPEHDADERKPVATMEVLDGQIALVTMNSGEQNILTRQLRDDLTEIFDAVDQDLSIRCIVLRSAGAHFTAGGDLREDQAAVTEEQRQDYVTHGSRFLDRIDTVRVPVIAAINRGALGGGFELVLACDIRIAASDAFFVAAGVNVGLIVNWFRLARIAGIGPAKEILLTGERYTAQQALTWGLVTEIHAPEDLEAAALKKARRIASRAPLSVEATKRSMAKAFDLDTDGLNELQFSQFGAMLATDDHQEALRAFFERRPAHFERH